MRPVRYSRSPTSKGPAARRSAADQRCRLRPTCGEHRRQPLRPTGPEVLDALAVAGVPGHVRLRVERLLRPPVRKPARYWSRSRGQHGSTADEHRPRWSAPLGRTADAFDAAAGSASALPGRVKWTRVLGLTGWTIAHQARPLARCRRPDPDTDFNLALSTPPTSGPGALTADRYPDPPATPRGQSASFYGALAPLDLDTDRVKGSPPTPPPASPPTPRLAARRQPLHPSVRCPPEATSSLTPPP